MTSKNAKNHQKIKKYPVPLPQKKIIKTKLQKNHQKIKK